MKKKTVAKKKTSKKTVKKTIPSSSLDLDIVLENMLEWAFDCGEILNTHLVQSYEKPLKILDK